MAFFTQIYDQSKSLKHDEQAKRNHDGHMGRRKWSEEREREKDDRCDTEPQSDSYLTLELVTYRLLYGHSICSHSLFLFVAVRQTHKGRQREGRKKSQGPCFFGRNVFYLPIKSTD